VKGSKTRDWLRVVVFLLLSGAGRLQSAQAPIQVEGGECLFMSLQLLAEVYRAKEPGFAMDVRVDAEAKAVQDLTGGMVQMAMVARDLTSAEVAGFQAKWGYPPTRIAVALDALVIVVHKDNPVKSMRVEETNAVFTEDRGLGWPKDILTWGDAKITDPAWANEPIRIFTRARDSSVKNLIIQFLYPSYHLRPAMVVPDAMAMTEAIAANRNGICCANMVDVFDSLKAIGIQPTGGKAVYPTPENVSSGAYPWSRFLYVYVNKHPRTGLPPEIRKFLAFVLSAEGQRLVQAVGQAPLPKDINALNVLKVMDTFDADPAALRGN